MRRCVVLTGAGVSAESGISTFRDADGLWEGHDVMQVASPTGWRQNQQLVLDFYNARRRQLHEVSPNAAHYAIRQLESLMDVTVITQNVDHLHEEAGSSKIVHLHGELMKARSSRRLDHVVAWDQDIKMGQQAADGSQLRPHIVWFGEAVPMIDTAIQICSIADVAIIIGTSMQVYPAASLISYVPHHCEIYYVDPQPTINYELKNAKNLSVIQGKASEHVPLLVNRLLSS